MVEALGPEERTSQLCTSATSPGRSSSASGVAGATCRVTCSLEGGEEGGEEDGAVRGGRCGVVWCGAVRYGAVLWMAGGLCGLLLR